MDPKQRAAEAAIDELRDGMVVGLGTGSTVEFFLRALGDRIRSGALRQIRGIPTSLRSEQRARELGIPITSFAQSSRIDVTIDGADEVDPKLNLIKGLGGALMREKIVAQNSDRMIVIADSSKLVATLVTKGPLPVEVSPFGCETHDGFLRSLGADPTLRCDTAGDPVVTDNGNYIYDCRFGRIEDAHGLESKLMRRGGIVATGLFLGIASLALIGDDDSVQRRVR
ncbi:MAG: ribose-5-phosphate isomerase RpiA [Tepidisphaeraceae bacterium]